LKKDENMVEENIPILCGDDIFIIEESILKKFAFLKREEAN
jgi:hypothetical protein